MTANSSTTQSAKFDVLLRGLAEAGPDGAPRYTRTQVADVMAVVFMRSHQKVPLGSQASDALMADFFSRVGVSTEADLDRLDELFADYFARSPLQQDLLKVMVTALQSDQAPPRPLRAGYAISSAF